jgi:hypothetical protein
MVRSRACWAKAVFESDGLAQGGIDPTEHGEHDRYGLSGGFSGQSRGERHAGFAFVEDEHGPRALADDEVAFPMANVGAGFDVFRIAGGSRPARPSALVTAGQVP